MCCGCSNKAKRWWAFGVSTLIGITAIVLGVVWPKVVRDESEKQFVLQPGTEVFKNWLNPPVDTFLELYLWNWTNPEDYLREGYVPHMEQLGPYTFKEVQQRVNLTWNDDYSLTYYQKRLWHYEPERSNGDLENDVVITINPILVTIGFALINEPIFLSMIDALINANPQMVSTPFYTVTAKEILFEGYDDIFLTSLLDLANSIPEIGDLVELPPYDKFGWFYGRNESETYDGNFTVGTGADNLQYMGVMRLWNGADRTPFYPGECGRVLGSTGELWPPFQKDPKANVTVFSPDICSAMSLELSGEFSLHGVNGYKWIGNERPFDNGHTYEETACQCTASDDECPVFAPGVLDVSSCRLGAPATVSYPHFYLAHPSYRENIDGMNPTKKDHEFMFALEPYSGVPLAVRAQLQVNLRVEDYGLTILKGVPNVMLPVLWFRQTAELSEELAKDLKLLLILPDIGVYIAIGLGVVAALGFAVSLYMSLKVWKTT